MVTGSPEQRQMYLRPLAALALLLTLLPPMLGADVHATPVADTPVGGPIISDTTWTLAGSPYLATSNVQVMAGVTLTIQAGVVVKFNTDKLLQVDGTLIARGTPTAPITFTSSQASPQPWDWGNIQFTDSSVDATFDGGGNYAGGCILEYCTVEYGGGGYMPPKVVDGVFPLLGPDANHDRAEASVYGTIQADAAAPLIAHCTVRNNGRGGIYAVATSDTPVVIRDNVISGNSGGYSGGVFVYYGTVTGNTVRDNKTVYQGGGIHAIYSTIADNFVSGNWSDNAGGGIYAYGTLAMNNTVSGNSAHRGGGIYADHSTVTGNTVSDNSVTNYYDGNGGGIYADGGNTVAGNIVSGNSATHDGGGIFAYENNTITNNIVSGNSAIYYGGGIYAWGSAVLSNTITANNITMFGQGAGVYYAYYEEGSPDFLYNTVVGNTTSTTGTVGGVALKGTPQFHYNNLYGNSPYDAATMSYYYGGAVNISSTHNYWGTTASVDILDHVYDWYDDANRGRLLFIPYLHDLAPQAPVPPPLHLRGTVSVDAMTLSWDPLPSTSTGYGYKVYYDNDAPGPPYHGTGAAQGNSPVDVGHVTSYTLSGLGSGTHYFAVTAYDLHGRESWYSNEVNDLRKVYLPLIWKDYRPATATALRGAPTGGYGLHGYGQEGYAVSDGDGATTPGNIGLLVLIGGLLALVTVMVSATMLVGDGIAIAETLAVERSPGLPNP